ncbi:unnamed protein product [Cylicocyclus nassatus]|uniref:Uncharacterized protein n=1 Tax=Cylicocyclus nassatus TaxID=53992 RepID=A0AA36MCR3_CYLNA|nr:unnamed protein product [Cylicocyclus nassatus]
MHPEIVEMEKDAFVVRLDDIRDRLQRSHIISLSTMIDILDGQQPEAVPIYRMRAYIYEALTVAEAGLNGTTGRPLQSFRAMQLHERSTAQIACSCEDAFPLPEEAHSRHNPWERLLPEPEYIPFHREQLDTPSSSETESDEIEEDGEAVFLHGIAKRAKIHFSTRSFHCSVPAASCHQGMEENGYEAAPVQIALIRIYELLRLFQWCTILLYSCNVSMACE